MHLTTLKLTQFKNYESRTFQFAPRLNCITGLNGVGKTNILDAIHFICLTKSHRGLSDRHLITHGMDFLRVEGLFQEGEDATKIVIKYVGGQRKELEKNGNQISKITEYVGQFPVVMIAPDDISLIQEGSEERRRYIDSTLSQLDHDYLNSLIMYNALLKQRNALLKMFGEQRRFDATLLESIDHQMPIHATVLLAQRRRFATILEPLVSELYTIISGSRESVSLTYESDVQDPSMYASVLSGSQEKDRYLERTNVGPHKDELDFLIEGQSVKRFASQGQLKSFLLALRLAQYDILRQAKGFAPILLLDDIFDKLDEHRVRQLLTLLLEKDFGQVFITDTHKERLEAAIAPYQEQAVFFDIE